MQLERTGNIIYQELLRMYAYGTWSEYKSKQFGLVSYQFVLVYPIHLRNQSIFNFVFLVSLDESFQDETVWVYFG